LPHVPAPARPPQLRRVPAARAAAGRGVVAAAAAAVADLGRQPAFACQLCVNRLQQCLTCARARAPSTASSILAGGAFHGVRGVRAPRPTNRRGLAARLQRGHM